MKNKLYCGSAEYEMTPEFRQSLDTLMYWIVESKFAQARGIRDDFRRAQDSIYAVLESMKEMGVPEWVEAGIVAYAETHDPNECTAKSFFENSIYAKKTEPEREF